MLCAAKPSWLLPEQEAIVQIKVNGEAREVPADLSLEQLLVDLKIPGREGVAVALNLRVVRRQERQGLQLSEGDRIDIVTAVGGG